MFTTKILTVDYKHNAFHCSTSSQKCVFYLFFDSKYETLKQQWIYEFVITETIHAIRVMIKHLNRDFKWIDHIVIFRTGFWK